MVTVTRFITTGVVYFTWNCGCHDNSQRYHRTGKLSDTFATSYISRDVQDYRPPLRFLRPRPVQFDVLAESDGLRRALRRRIQVQPLYLHFEFKRRHLSFEKSDRFRRRMGHRPSIPFSVLLRIYREKNVEQFRHSILSRIGYCSRYYLAFQVNWNSLLTSSFDNK